VRDFCATWSGESIALDKTTQNGDYILNQTAGREAVYDEILAMIDRAEHTILIEAPYVIGDKLENALLKAAQRGVTITLILPSNVNKAVFRWWLPASMRKLTHPNITFYGFQGHGGMTHAKLYLFDDKWVTFGSLNVFELECMMQKEINIFSTNANLIAQLKQLAQADLAQSVPLPISQRGGLRFTHTLAHIGYSLWIKLLIKNPRWRKKYC
jgi:phosphatidylserine/phosphatidylglycerophosphate/cardiolipin synthase-like enzyme